MYRFLVSSAVALVSLAAVASPQATSSRGEQARVTVGVPVYVSHPDRRSGGREWNEGWLDNEGVLGDVSWPWRKLGADTSLRLGATAGVFDNSEFRTSVFLGGMAEIETFATRDLAFSVGTYAGALTGYKYDVVPAIAPYVGTSYTLTDTIEIGARGFWMPGRTLGGSSVDSDAYVGAVTLGTRF